MESSREHPPRPRLAACATHLAVHSGWLTLASAALPAFAGIRSHAEFEIVVRRAEAAGEGLGRVAAGLRGRRAVSSRDLAAAAEAASGLMIEETLSWRLVSQARPLELSG